jgi:hypothetical protein
MFSVLNTKCGMNCLIATGLFTSMLYVMLNPNKDKVHRDFEALLDDSQRELYQSVIQERMNLYVQGLVLGLLLGFVYLNYISTPDTRSACVFTIIVLGVNNLYYGVMPKSAYMLPSLTNPQQVEAWLAVYKEMKRRCVLGFILGAIAYLLIGSNVAGAGPSKSKSKSNTSNNTKSNTSNNTTNNSKNNNKK